MAKLMKQIDHGARVWLARTATKQYWRVAVWYELDDLVQDGLMCWQIVACKYKRANRRHLMSLFQITYINHIHKLANKRTACAPELAMEELPEQFCPDGEMNQLVNEAPAALRQCLRTLLNQPELLARAMSDGQRRKTTTEWLRDITGVDVDAEQLREYLQHG
jgi:DNA-directed RNA polymerase specialized sigma24 family protein